MVTHSNILAWKIPRTEVPGGLQSMGLRRAGHDLVTQQQYSHLKSMAVKVMYAKDFM